MLQDMPKVKFGQIYWIVTDWTSKGMRVEECIWRDDFTDFERVRKNEFHSTKKETEYTLKNLN